MKKLCCLPCSWGTKDQHGNQGLLNFWTNARSRPRFLWIQGKSIACLFAYPVAYERPYSGGHGQKYDKTGPRPEILSYISTDGELEECAQTESYGTNSQEYVYNPVDSDAGSNSYVIRKAQKSEGQGCNFKHLFQRTLQVEIRDECIRDYGYHAKCPERAPPPWSWSCFHSSSNDKGAL